MDAALRLAERALARARAADYSHEGVVETVDALDDLNTQRARAGLAPLCAECMDEPAEREENCDCEEDRCASCHASAMEHGHRHVHDADNRFQCCPACFREVMALKNEYCACCRSTGHQRGECPPWYCTVPGTCNLHPDDERHA